MFTSAGNHAAISFKTDGSVTRSGFRVTVRAVCGGSTTATNGVVTSPGYPDNYPPGANCVWLVKGGGGTHTWLVVVHAVLFS